MDKRHVDTMMTNNLDNGGLVICAYCGIWSDTTPSLENNTIRPNGQIQFKWRCEICGKKFIRIWSQDSSVLERIEACE